MEFSVNTRALPGLTDMLERRRDDLETGRTYLAKYAHISFWGYGLLREARHTHTHVVAAIDSFLHRAAWDRAEALSWGVGEATRYYQQADAAAVARFDAAQAPPGNSAGHPGKARPLADQQLGPQIFLETSCGPGYPAPHDYHFDCAPISTAIDGLSEANLAREAVWKVTGALADAGLLDHPVDLAQEYVAQVTGDWAAFRTCADAFDTIAAELELNAGWVGHDATILPSAWSGNVADVCAYAVSTFAADLLRAGGTVRNVAATYRDAAEHIKELTEALITVLTLLVDECVDKAVEELVPIAGEVGELLAALRLVRKAKKIISEMNELVKLFKAVFGAGDGPFADLGQLGELNLTEVSTTALPASGSGGRWLRAE